MVIPSLTFGYCAGACRRPGNCPRYSGGNARWPHWPHSTSTRSWPARSLPNPEPMSVSLPLWKVASICVTSSCVIPIGLGWHTRWKIRVPLVDSVAFPVLARALTGVWAPPAGKQSLGRAPNPPLPIAVLARSKTGFSVPMAERAVNQPDFSDWRRITTLAHPRCSWGRRWSYVVACQFGMV
jgi:hypothetical protein